LIDGTFPDYQRVIPKGNDKMMTVPARAFQDAVDRVATISSEKSRAVKLEAKPGMAVVTANSPELGTASDELEVAYDGPEIQIGFNARYLLDITGLIGGADMTFEMMDSVSPTLVKNAEDEASVFVLMPMRV
ncbi:MAG: DNA polymerase III subunit beta, partial [Alphaproteobacteria bacterium]